MAFWNRKKRYKMYVEPNPYSKPWFSTKKNLDDFVRKVVITFWVFVALAIIVGAVILTNSLGD